VLCKFLNLLTQQTKLDVCPITIEIVLLDCLNIDISSVISICSADFVSRSRLIMKYVMPEISWHGRDPLYSVDLQCSCGPIRRLATCGTDRVVRVHSFVLLESRNVTVAHIECVTFSFSNGYDFKFVIILLLSL